MTLFRKVFQNQARPATSEEALDEEALREAFKSADASGEPLVLDPFEHSLEQESSDDAAGSDDDPDHEPEEFSGVVEEDEISSEDVAEEELEMVLDPAIFGEDNVDPVHKHEATRPDEDEDIVQRLGRALATEEYEDTAEDTVELAEELSGEFEFTAADEELILEEETADEHSQELEFASASEDVPQDDAPEEEVADEGISDLASFAQQQLSVLDEADNPQADCTEDPVVEEGGLDLSNVTDMPVVPAPAAGRAGRRAGRVKTRLLGFNRGDQDENDPFGQPREATAAPEREKFPVGWLVIVDGPGIGHSFSIFAGASMIGRGDDQVIRLDFGDNSISRNNHAAIAYDDEENKFYIGHGGKSNIIRRNARPVLSTEELHHADLLRIGETTLRFVALCGSDFQWTSAGGSNAAGV